MSMRQPFVPAAAFLLVAVAGCSEPPEFVSPPPPPVTVDHPVVDEVVVYFEGPGRTEAVDSVQILARVGGFIQEIHFADGEFVDAGAPLFQIEPDQYQAAVNQAMAAAESARATRDLAAVRLDRVKKVAAADAANELEVLEAEANHDEAQAAVRNAEAQLESAQLNLGYTTVTAPFAGRISESHVDLGELVGPTGVAVLADLASLNPIYVYWNAGERGVLQFQNEGRKIPRSEDGQEIPVEDRIIVRLRLTDESIYEHEGYIDYASPSIDPTTGTLRLRVRIPNPEYKLFPGQFARVLVAKFEGEATLVPEIAVMRDVVGPFLLVVDDNNIVGRRDVTLGDLVDDRRIILDGITPDDRIVTIGVQRARVGLPVTPQPPPGSAPASDDDAGSSTPGDDHSDSNSP